MFIVLLIIFELWLFYMASLESDCSKHVSGVMVFIGCCVFAAYILGKSEK